MTQHSLHCADAVDADIAALDNVASSHDREANAAALANRVSMDDDLSQEEAPTTAQEACELCSRQAWHLHRSFAKAKAAGQIHSSFTFGSEQHKNMVK